MSNEPGSEWWGDDGPRAEKELRAWAAANKHVADAVCRYRVTARQFLEAHGYYVLPEVHQGEVSYAVRAFGLYGTILITGCPTYDAALIAGALAVAKEKLT